LAFGWSLVIMRFFSCCLGIAISILAFSSTLHGQESAPRRIRQSINDARIKRLAGNVHPLARARYETGVAPADLPMDHMMLVLTPSAEQRTKLNSLVGDLHDPASSRFHQWLTPERFGEEFGAAEGDIQTITGWLQSHGFQVEPVLPGRTFLEFSGTAAQVNEAFHTQIRQYTVNQESHWANASDPEIPEALAPVVAGVATLHNFAKKAQLKSQLRPQASPIQTAFESGLTPQYTSSSGAHYLSPADYAVIYNINPLYQAGITGAGRSIAVVARTNINVSDINDFRSTFGLSVNPPQVIVNGRDPGNLGGDEEAEAVLDTSWTGAVAPGATVKLVVSRSTNTTDGVDLSEAYIINNNLSDVMTESFGDCEANYTSAQGTLYSSLAAQAAAQGITYLVASGDSGAAGCDSPSQTAATKPISVNILASNPYVIAVGGTQLNDTSSPSSYWRSSNSSNDSSALSYIPETVWNESCSVAQCGRSTAGLWASSGGASTFYAKPSWQSGVTGIPSDGARDVPDISLTASGHDAYLVCINHSCPNSSGRISFSGYSGTSAATPSFAGVIALVAQKAGARQGQANFNLYRLAAAQNMSLCNGSSAEIVSSGSNCIFNDVTVGNNAVPGETDYGTLTAKYQAGVGYDQATGLGSVNVANLVNNWNASTVSVGAPLVTLSASSLDFRTQPVGLSSTQSVTVTNDGSGSLTISSISLANTSSTFFSQSNNCTGVLAAGTSCTISIVFTPRSMGSFTGSLSVVDNASGSPRTVSLSGSGTATNDVSVSPTNLTFSTQKVQSRSGVQIIQIVNSTPQTVAISNVSIGRYQCCRFQLGEHLRVNTGCRRKLHTQCGLYAAESRQPFRCRHRNGRRRKYTASYLCYGDRNINGIV
jgi:subtilase family serine protease